MINWISTSDTSRKPEIGKPVFIRGAGRRISFAYAMACVWRKWTPDQLEKSSNWEPYPYGTSGNDEWDFETVTHWAEIPEGLFNEPAA